MMQSGYIKRILCLMVYGFFVGGFLLLYPTSIIFPGGDDYPASLSRLLIPVLTAAALGAAWGFSSSILLEKSQSWHTQLQNSPIAHLLWISLLLFSVPVIGLWFDVIRRGYLAFAMTDSFYMGITAGCAFITFLVACLWRYLYPFEKRKFEDLRKAKS